MKIKELKQLFSEHKDLKKTVIKRMASTVRPNIQNDLADYLQCFTWVTSAEIQRAKNYGFEKYFESFDRNMDAFKDEFGHFSSSKVDMFKFEKVYNLYYGEKLLDLFFACFEDESKIYDGLVFYVVEACKELGLSLDIDTNNLKYRGNCADCDYQYDDERCAGKGTISIDRTSHFFSCNPCYSRKNSSTYFPPLGLFRQFEEYLKTRENDEIQAENLQLEPVMMRFCGHKHLSTDTYTFNSANVGMASNVGGRNENQDSSIICSHPEDSSCLLVAVADGMGGLEKGGEFSGRAIYYLEKWFKELSVSTISDVSSIKSSLEKYVLNINSKLEDFKTRKKISEGGTTLSVAVVWNGRILLLNIGDSRIYNYKDNSLTLLTKDDSIVWSGPEGVDRERFNLNNHYITNYLPLPSPVISCEIVPTANMKDYGYLILCTDGVSDKSASYEMMDIITRSLGNTSLLPKQLVDFAVKNNAINEYKNNGDSYYSCLPSENTDNATVACVNLIPYLQAAKHKDYSSTGEEEDSFVDDSFAADSFAFSAADDNEPAIYIPGQFRKRRK